MIVLFTVAPSIAYRNVQYLNEWSKAIFIYMFQVIRLTLFWNSVQKKYFINFSWNTWTYLKILLYRLNHFQISKSVVFHLLLHLYGLEKEMANHFSILAWKIPWTEEPDGLQSMGSQRGGLDWKTNTYMGLHCTFVTCGFISVYLVTAVSHNIMLIKLSISY